MKVKSNPRRGRKKKTRKRSSSSRRKPAKRRGSSASKRRRRRRSSSVSSTLTKKEIEELLKHPPQLYNPAASGVRHKRILLANPMGALGGILDDLRSAPLWYTAGHILGGAGATGAASKYLLNRTPLARVGLLHRRDVVGSAARLGVCSVTAGALSALAGVAADYLGNPAPLRGVRTNVLIGGLAYSLAKFLADVIPAGSIPFGIPSMEASDVSGMGALLSPEELVAGESVSRLANEGVGDWMELSGMGSSGGAPVPMEDLRGYPGQYGGSLGDWAELVPSSEIARAGFSPVNETF